MASGSHFELFLNRSAELHVQAPPLIVSDVAMCVCSGEPHCRSFDGVHIDYQGTCRLLMSSSCRNSTNAHYYEVYIKNVNLNGVSSVSYPYYIEVYVLNSNRVRMTRNYIPNVLVPVDVDVSRPVDVVFNLVAIATVFCLFARHILHTEISYGTVITTPQNAAQ